MRELVEEVEVPGAMLRTASQGVGLPLVLNHGGPGLSDNLEPLARMVEDLALVHRYDQRGSGRSRSAGPFDVSSFIADLDALRRHWGHERWLVGGHSWGANLSLFYALAHPTRTIGVIYLAGTGLRWGWQEDAQRRRLARLTQDERAELALLERQVASGDMTSLKRYLRLIRITDLADRRHTGVLDEQAFYQFARNEDVFRTVNESYKALLDSGLEDRVRRLEAPLLVIHGAEDTDPARARQVAELAPNGRWAQIERAAHSPWDEKPAELRELLRTFIAQLA